MIIGLFAATTAVAAAGKPVGPPPPPFQTLYTFPGLASPVSALVQGFDGNFYGISIGEGASTCGAIFKITPGASLTTLREIACAQGSEDLGGLVLGSDGNLYGTASQGGNAPGSPCSSQGCGSIFKVTPSGDLTVLFDFDRTNGAGPTTSLVQGFDGDFYGSTSYGGKYGGGTIFKITASGSLNTIYDFCTSTCEGPGPNTLVEGNDGNFYGTTATGGAPRAGNAGTTVSSSARHCKTQRRLTSGRPRRRFRSFRARRSRRRFPKARSPV